MHIPLISILSAATVTALLTGVATGAALHTDASVSVKRQASATLKICTLDGTICQDAPASTSVAKVSLNRNDFTFATYGYLKKRAAGDKYHVTGCLDSLIDVCSTVDVVENGPPVPLTLGIVVITVSIE